MKKPKLDIINCGQIKYSDALQMQQEYLAKRQENLCENTVLVLEHPPVITLGARESENRLVLDEKTINDKGVDIFHVRRGGGTTAHNPGQLVFYPIIDLRSISTSITDFIRTLEQVGIDFLKEFQIEAQRRKGFPGLWVGKSKIASIGVRVSRGCTYHGMAINISNDLDIFNYIIPCGLEGVKMVSVKTLTDNEISFEKSFENLVKTLKEYF